MVQETRFPDSGNYWNQFKAHSSTSSEEMSAVEHCFKACSGVYGTDHIEDWSTEGKNFYSNYKYGAVHVSDFWVRSDNLCYCHVAPSSDCLEPPNVKLSNTDPNVRVYSIGYTWSSVCRHC